MGSHQADKGAERGTTGERRLAGWQRALRWIAWLTFLGVAIKNSDRSSFGALEFLTLAIAIGVSVWCMARPLGGPKVDIEKASDVRGPFVSRTSWGLVLLGTILTVGGIGATGAIIYDVSTGRATIHDVANDMGVFVVGWIAERIGGWSYDAHLEDTHAYALFVLIFPGLLLLWFNLVPFVNRGREFRIDPDTSITVKGPRGWFQILEYEYATVTADGTTIRFTPSAQGTPTIVLPQARVFSQETEARLSSEVSAAFFHERLERRGFTVESHDKSRFTATPMGAGK